MTAELVELALVVVGLTAGPVPSAYAALIAFDETDARAAEMSLDSGCGLVVRGLWRRWCALRGTALPEALAAPYRAGTIIAALVSVARDARAIEAGNAPNLEPGDVVLLSDPEHVEVVVGDGWRVAGGQRDAAGRETILCVSRGTPAMPAPVAPSRVLLPRTVSAVLRWRALAPYLAQSSA